MPSGECGKKNHEPQSKKQIEKAYYLQKKHISRHKHLVVAKAMSLKPNNLQGL
jgi:hypothetical protein